MRTVLASAPRLVCVHARSRVLCARVGKVYLSCAAGRNDDGERLYAHLFKGM